MKKTVVVDLEFMRPKVGGGRSRSRSKSRTGYGSSGLSDDEDTHQEMNIKSLLHNTYDDYNDDYDDDNDYNDDYNDDNEYDNDTEYDDVAIGSDELTEVQYTSDEEYAQSPAPVPSHKQVTATAPAATKKKPKIKDSDYGVNSDDDLLQSVLDEPTFPMDINAILSAMSKTENNTIANMTRKKIAAQRHEILSSLNLTPIKLEEFDKSLRTYRVIENPYELKHHQQIRWIPLRSLETNPYLTKGGALVKMVEDVKEGVHVVTVRNIQGFFINIKFELNVVFQNLSNEELLILRAVEYVEDDGRADASGATSGESGASDIDDIDDA